MLIRHSEIEVPADNPFQHDALERKHLEPPLTQFITQATGPFVLALDSSWGSGKTTFLRMWQVKLKDAGHVCLYLNSWKTDFAQDPLVAVVGELSEAIQGYAPAGAKGDAIKKRMRTARKIAESIAKRAIPVGIKIATLGIIDTEQLTEKIISDFASEIVESGIRSYEEGKSEIEEFRKSLLALTEEISSIHLDSKVVIIVDELDRCRPTYSIQLLERIKHLFDVPGVVFILGIDRTQLNHSIQALYGIGFDSFGYLKRFIDLDYRLPEPKLNNYCFYLFQRFGIEEIILKRKTGRNEAELRVLRVYLGGLISASRMSLREQEQTIARLRIVLQTIPINYYLYEYTLSILLFLREWNYGIYTALIEGKKGIEDVLKELEKLLDRHEASKEIDFDVIEAALINCDVERNQRSPRLELYREQFQSEMERSKEYLKARKILECINHLHDSFGRIEAGFQITIERLALTTNFVSHEST